MELRLVPKLQQSLVITPQLKMAIKLLTLNHMELRDAVAAELVENPVLEETYDDAETNESQRERQDAAHQVDQAASVDASATEISMDKDSQKENANEIDWENYLDSHSFLPPAAGSGADSSFDGMPGIDQTLTRSETLEEHLIWQLQMSDMNPLEVQIGLRLIGEMRDDGFIDAEPRKKPPTKEEVAAAKAMAKAKAAAKKAKRKAKAEGRDEASMEAPETPALEVAPKEAVTIETEAVEPLSTIEMVAEELSVPVEWVNNVRRRLMLFDPIGVLALDLRECLICQLEAWGYDNECLVYNIVNEHMDDVEKRQYGNIAKKYDVPMADVGEALKLIETLEPRPARNFLPPGTTSESQYITPDVYVVKVDGEYMISLNEDGMPKLKISPFYLEKLREAERGDPSKSYIKDKMRAATWLIRSIHQRQRTIHKVVESILKRQRDWFEQKGPLKPLILKEIADDIEMHESTVSRVTTRKYLHCHRGIFELKYFFNSSISTGDGEAIASEAVKDEIKRIVSEENPKKPFSDSAIVRMLTEKNITIARRTVAKYREVLGILPSNKRKQVF